MIPACAFENRILKAVRLGFVDGEAREHAAGCGECAQLLAVAGLLREARRADFADARPPAAGAVWFRIHLRARRATARRSSRAATLIQALSLLTAALGAVAIVGVPRIVAALSGIPDFVLPWAGPILYAVAVLALLAPVAVAFALARR